MELQVKLHVKKSHFFSSFSFSMELNCVCAMEKSIAVARRTTLHLTGPYTNQRPIESFY